MKCGRSTCRTLGEFEVLPDSGEIIERTPIEVGVNELIPVVQWTQPLHVVVVDDIHAEERIATVPEPDKDRWSSDLK